MDAKTKEQRQAELKLLLAKGAVADTKPVEICYDANLTADGEWLLKMDLLKALDNTHPSSTGRSKVYNVNVVIAPKVRFIGNLIDAR